jgi:hypothetical protein
MIDRQGNDVSAGHASFLNLTSRQMMLFCHSLLTVDNFSLPNRYENTPTQGLTSFKKFA